MKEVVCANCGRVFTVYSVSDKHIYCPYCAKKGNNPYYIRQPKIKPKDMFIKMDDD